MSRDIDWRSYLSSLTYCFGCGRFGVPKRGKPPRGWRMIYQPHQDGPAGLAVCSNACADDVREAMSRGPVHEPLRIGKPPIMDADMRHQMMEDMAEESVKQISRENPLAFSCAKCGVGLNPVTPSGIPGVFSCPRCGSDYLTREVGPGQFEFNRVTVTKINERGNDDDSTVSRSVEDDPRPRSPEG